MVLDGMDGRVAPANTQSAFGEQFDSLSDSLIRRGSCLVMHEWVLGELGRWGWAGAFVCAGAALRPARFNSNIGVVDKRYFRACPALRQQLIADSSARDRQQDSSERQRDAVVAFGLTVYTGLTVVSSAPFPAARASGGAQRSFWS
jgi:CDP-diacylglycerol--serine O-phosphatidyltransferase